MKLNRTERGILRDAVEGNLSLFVCARDCLERMRAKGVITFELCSGKYLVNATAFGRGINKATQ